MKISRILCLLACVITTQGCSWLFGDEGHFRDRTYDYKSAEQVKRMEVPPESKPRINDLYPTVDGPNVDAAFSPSKEMEVPKPEAIISVITGEGVQIRRDSEKDWIWIDKSPSSVWPIIKSYFNGLNFPLSAEDDAKGMLETTWLQKFDYSRSKGVSGEAATEGKDKVIGKYNLRRIRVDLVTNEERDVTGILLSMTHQKVKRFSDLPDSESIEWISKSEKKDLRTKTVNDLVKYILSEQTKQDDNQLAHDDSLPRVVLTKDGNGYPVLVVEWDFNRTWETVGASLARADLPVDDINRTAGIFYLKNSWKKEKDDPELLELKLSKGENGILIAVQQDDESLAPVENCEFILNKIKENLFKTDRRG